MTERDGRILASRVTAETGASGTQAAAAAAAQLARRAIAGLEPAAGGTA